MLLDDHSAQLIDRYLVFILKENESINLTRITSLESARILHVEDSLSALDEVNQALSGLYGDLGTGGGFPGVPLAIVTGRKTVLVDSVKKKVAVVARGVEHIGLADQISTYDGRIEDLARDMKGKFSVLTARALSQLPSLMELACPLLKVGGRLVCYKARISEEELAHAQKIERLLNMKMISRRGFLLSDHESYREIVVFEKTGKPRISLPRRVGLAQKNPLG